ncbi:cytochrome P450 [Streptomyces sp. H27-H1]|uniref:cytochrome P450 n=1 Tax=Streptomyces sp. H27-H1 TaxID=2996461 RepID=UPI00226EC836|nr:cytochrome P450 [Streptomyces sp. H27-H1]MCY0928017.1 cytochrome P450 [Streptomyces sp. H27-H1]
MTAASAPWTDSTLSLLARGYAWLPDRMRATHGGPVRTRLLGRPAIALRGPEAIGFFYDERHIERTSALPEPVLDTLFGQGAVHTLDGDAHRVRKAMFLALLKDGAGIAALTEHVALQWSKAVTGWSDGRKVVLFDEAALILARSVCEWTGVRLSDEQSRQMAEDCTAMVDGFATPGPRHWRARTARYRQEEALAELVRVTREGGELGSDSGTALEAVAWHRDSDGRLLDPHTGAVELLNIIRPTVAIAWFAAFAGHALHRWPAQREPLRAEHDGQYARAFAHEVRRFYPFAPFVGGLAAADLTWQGETIAKDTLVLLDLYGHNHDPGLWDSPYRFDPQRFAGREPGADELIPQGGGDPARGHRCPGEDITVAVLATLVTQLAALDYDVPEQDLTIPLSKIPTRPCSGLVFTTTQAAPWPGDARHQQEPVAPTNRAR